MTRTTRSILLALLWCLSVVWGTVGCKSKQKIAEEQNLRIEAENTEKAKAILNAILRDNGEMTLSQKEYGYQQAKSIGSDDPEVLDLLAQVEAQLARERESQPLADQKPPAMDEPVVEKESPLRERVGSLLDNVATAGSISRANQLIQDNLDLFSSPDALVLIIINKSGDIKDYDEPTTISKYLNYLKDQKNNPNAVYNLAVDESGKIKEVELIKK